jgi:hypothetical protein
MIAAVEGELSIKYQQYRRPAGAGPPTEGRLTEGTARHTLRRGEVLQLPVDSEQKYEVRIKCREKMASFMTLSNEGRPKRRDDGDDRKPTTIKINLARNRSIWIEIPPEIESMDTPEGRLALRMAVQEEVGIPYYDQVVTRLSGAGPDWNGSEWSVRVSGKGGGKPGASGDRQKRKKSHKRRREWSESSDSDSEEEHGGRCSRRRNKMTTTQETTRRRRRKRGEARQFKENSQTKTECGTHRPCCKSAKVSTCKRSTK